MDTNLVAPTELVDMDQHRARKLQIDRELAIVREEFETRLSKETHQQYAALEARIRESFAGRRDAVMAELAELAKRRQTLSQELERIRDEENRAVEEILGRESFVGRTKARVVPVVMSGPADVIIGVLRGKPWQTVRAVAVAAHGLHGSMGVASFQTKIHTMRQSGALASKPNPVQGEGVLVALPEDAGEPIANANESACKSKE